MKQEENLKQLEAQQPEEQTVGNEQTKQTSDAVKTEAEGGAEKPKARKPRAKKAQNKPETALVQQAADEPPTPSTGTAKKKASTGASAAQKKKTAATKAGVPAKSTRKKSSSAKLVSKADADIALELAKASKESSAIAQAKVSAAEAEVVEQTSAVQPQEVVVEQAFETVHEKEVAPTNSVETTDAQPQQEPIAQAEAKDALQEEVSAPKWDDIFSSQPDELAALPFEMFDSEAQEDNLLARMTQEEHSDEAIVADMQQELLAETEPGEAAQSATAQAQPKQMGKSFFDRLRKWFAADGITLPEATPVMAQQSQEAQEAAALAALAVDAADAENEVHTQAETIETSSMADDAAADAIKTVDNAEAVEDFEVFATAEAVEDIEVLATAEATELAEASEAVETAQDTETAKKAQAPDNTDIMDSVESAHEAVAEAITGSDAPMSALPELDMAAEELNQTAEALMQPAQEKKKSFLDSVSTMVRNLFGAQIGSNAAQAPERFEEEATLPGYGKESAVTAQSESGALDAFTGSLQDVPETLPEETSTESPRAQVEEETAPIEKAEEMSAQALLVEENKHQIADECAAEDAIAPDLEDAQTRRKRKKAQKKAQRAEERVKQGQEQGAVDAPTGEPLPEQQTETAQDTQGGQEAAFATLTLAQQAETERRDTDMAETQTVAETTNESTGETSETGEGSEPADDAQDHEEGDAHGEEEAEQEADLDAQAEDYEHAERPQRPRGRITVFKVFVGFTAVATFVTSLFVVMLFLMSDNTLLKPKSEVDLPNFNGKDVSEVAGNPAFANFKIEFEDVYTNDSKKGTIVDQRPKAPRQVKENAKIVLRVSAGVKTVEVPDVVGLDRDEAKQLVRDSDLNVLFKPAEDKEARQDAIAETEPRSGTVLNAGETVTLYIGRGEQDNITAKVPSCIGMTSTSSAGQLLSSRGLGMGAVRKVASGEPAGTIIGQSPAAGSVEPRGTPVTLTISAGVGGGVGGGVDGGGNVTGIAEDGHAHAFAVTPVAATETTPGFTIHTCTICGFYTLGNIG